MRKRSGSNLVHSVRGLRDYAELRRRVRETLLWGQQKIEEARVRTYWETGWWIKKHMLLNRHRARYGDKVLKDLSRDEGVSETVLDRCKQFAEKFTGLFSKPISAARQKLVVSPYPDSKNGIKSKLSWTHFRTLLPIENDQVRNRLAREAAREGWTVLELEARIKSLNSREKSGIKSLLPPQGSRPKTPLLKPNKGELFTYRIIEDQGALALDHGFTSYWNLSGQEAKKFSKGDIVRKLPDGKMKKLNEGSKSLLYTYEADVTRVVDADTIWMKIYLEGRGRPPWVKEKLRLRGIDAPELNTPEGRAAKKFVEDVLRGKQIVITTTKPDKWDRYLSDVFLTVRNAKIPTVGTRATGHEYTVPEGEDTREGDVKISTRSPQSNGIAPQGLSRSYGIKSINGIEEIYLNNLLLERGHASIKTDWSLGDWEGGVIDSE